MKWELTQEVNNHAYFRYEFVCYKSERARALVCVCAQIARSSLACDSWIWHTRNGLWIEGALFFMDKSDRREEKTYIEIKVVRQDWNRNHAWTCDETPSTLLLIYANFFLFHFSNTIDRSIWRFYVKYHLVVKSKICMRISAKFIRFLVYANLYGSTIFDGTYFTIKLKWFGETCS